MILVYTGEGKGKTSACLGQVLRALGNGLNVAFAQYMKRDGEAGEQIFLRQCLGDNFLAGGAGFFRHEKDRPLHRQAALRTLAWCRHRLAPVQDTMPQKKHAHAEFAAHKQPCTENPPNAATENENTKKIPLNANNNDENTEAHKGVDVLILDECLYALAKDLLTIDELQSLLEDARLSSTHLILSGRGFPSKLLPFVDMVTDMKEVKHPWQAGQQAVRGIDF